MEDTVLVTLLHLSSGEIIEVDSDDAESVKTAAQSGAPWVKVRALGADHVYTVRGDAIIAVEQHDRELANKYQR